MRKETKALLVCILTYESLKKKGTPITHHNILHPYSNNAPKDKNGLRSEHKANAKYIHKSYFGNRKEKNTKRAAQSGCKLGLIHAIFFQNLLKISLGGKTTESSLLSYPTVNNI